MSPIAYPDEHFAIHLISGYLHGYLGVGRLDRDSNYIHDVEIFRIEFIDNVKYAGQPPHDSTYALIRAIEQMIRKGTMRVTFISNHPPIVEVEGPSASVLSELRIMHPGFSSNSYSKSMADLQASIAQMKKLLPAFGQGVQGVSFEYRSKPKPRVRNLGVKDEVIVAYRDFDIGYDSWDNVWLKSRNGAIWPGYAPMVATCGTDLLKLKHDAPKKECECGIYAFDDPKHKNLQAQAIAWGEVALYGEVFICETGYRAEYAYPKTIFLRDNGTKIQKMMAGALEENYGVPVHISSDRTKTTGVLLDEWLAKATK